jgi:hypothetical protein
MGLIILTLVLGVFIAVAIGLLLGRVKNPPSVRKVFVMFASIVILLTLIAMMFAPGAEGLSRLEFTVKPKNCPKCGGELIADIMYGKPFWNNDLQRALDERRIVLGGCEVTGDDPAWTCASCKAVFYKTEILQNHEPLLTV